MKYFKGEIDQMPPPYSAKKYKGEALYKRVRAQKDYELKSSMVTVYFFELKKYSPPYLDFCVKCSSGTYIRSIAHDLGISLGCGAHLNRLKRTEIGVFRTDQSHTVEEIEEMAFVGQMDKFLHPMEVLLPEFPKIVVSDSDALLVRNGSIFFPGSNYAALSPEKETNLGEGQKKEILRIFDSQGKLLALAKKDTQKNSIHPFMVLV
jgi:tRNA pseudouridine55 synthase